MWRSASSAKDGTSFSEATIEPVWQKCIPERYASFRKDACVGEGLLHQHRRRARGLDHKDPRADRTGSRNLGAQGAGLELRILRRGRGPRFDARR